MRSLFTFAVAVAVAAGCGGSHAGDPDGGLDALGTGDDASVDPDADVPPDGAPISTCPAGMYCDEIAPIPTTTLLYAVHALTTADVFAVGNAGTIVRRKNNSWSQMTSGITANLRGVWAVSSSDVWAVGEGGAVLHFNGTAWAPVTVSTSDLNGVWASGANDVWIVGPSRIHHWNGITWSMTAVAGSLFSVTGTGPSDVWVSGENAKAKHYNGTGWTTVDPGIGTDVYAIKAISATNVWASGLSATKETANFTGSTWAPHGTSGNVFQSFHAFAPDDVWGVAGTKVGHWDGSAWTLTTPSGNTSSLWGVSGAGNELFIVGSGATIIHHN